MVSESIPCLAPPAGMVHLSLMLVIYWLRDPSSRWSGSPATAGNSDWPQRPGAPDRGAEDCAVTRLSLAVPPSCLKVSRRSLLKSVTGCSTACSCNKSISQPLHHSNSILRSCFAQSAATLTGSVRPSANAIKAVSSESRCSSSALSSSSRRPQRGAASKRQQHRRIAVIHLCLEPGQRLLCRPGWQNRSAGNDCGWLATTARAGR